MKGWTRWLAFLVGVGVALFVVSLVALFVVSEIILRRTYDVPLEAFSAPTDSASIASGKRLADIRGCYSGCHGAQLEGRVFFDEPGVARITAPDLTRVMYTYSDAELERVIRHGVRRNGRSVLAMPSDAFHELTDEDLGDIIAFVRSQPRTDGEETVVEAGPLGRLGLVLGQFRPIAAEIEHSSDHGQGPDGPSGPGRYLARTVCSECHGTDLQGVPADSVPPLTVVRAYSLEQFTTLLRTGEPVGGRTLGLMADVARSRFHAFTDDEIALLYNYLNSYGLESRSTTSH